jgi:hypothetical protein
MIGASIGGRECRVSIAIALVALALLGGCGDSGTEDATTTSAATEELASLIAAGELRRQVEGAIADLAAAGDAAEAGRAARRLEEGARRARALAGRAPDTRAGRAAKRSLNELAAAAEDLARTAGRVQELYELAAAERTPSAEAQDEVVEIASRLDRLRDELDAPERVLARSALTARRALLIVQPDLGPSDVEEVARLKVALARAARGNALGDVADAIADRSAALNEQVASLEPPDVVTDCTSEYYPNVTDMSVRNLDCAEADALTSTAIQALAPSFTIPGWSCSILGDYGPPGGPILGASDIRCVAGDRAFRFSFGD